MDNQKRAQFIQIRDTLLGVAEEVSNLIRQLVKEEEELEDGLQYQIESSTKIISNLDSQIQALEEKRRTGQATLERAQAALEQYRKKQRSRRRTRIPTSISLPRLQPGVPHGCGEDLL